MASRLIPILTVWVTASAAANISNSRLTEPACSVPPPGPAISENAGPVGPWVALAAASLFSRSNGRLSPSPVPSPTEELGETQAWRLPPGPGGATLVLSVLLPMGAWRAVRSARQWQSMTAPDWYHTTCPSQVGHAIAVPAHLDLSILPCCPLLTVTGTDAPKLPAHDFVRAGRLRRPSQFRMPTAAPRGPPGVCLGR